MGNPIPLLRALFQSTLLMRGATPYVRMSYLSWPFQSTLLMRGATAIMVAAVFHLRISIHAPHARSDCHNGCGSIPSSYFNPRSSCEERRDTTDAWSDNLISIHAPHARSDCFSACLTSKMYDFNPRSSCEERPRSSYRRASTRHFNPRSSCEERLLAFMIVKTASYFNPRSSCEERPYSRRR